MCDLSLREDSSPTPSAH